MANQPVVNRSSFVLIKKATAGTLLTGYGVVFTGGYSTDGFMLADYSVMPDGLTDTGAGQTTPGLTGAVQAGSISRLITGLSAGSHTFKLRWGTTAGSTRCRPVSAPNNEHASIVVMEIGS